MSLYEVVFIARQDLSLEDVDELAEKLSKVVLEGSGKIVSKEYWGLRNLAYQIKKNLRGHYFLLNVSASFSAVAELQRIMGYNSDVIRSMVFAVEKHHSRSELFVSDCAKDSNKAKSENPGESLKYESILSQLQFDA
jgi:small subunit ribosomal protein S6